MKIGLFILGIFIIPGLCSCTKDLSSELSKSINSNNQNTPADSTTIYVSGGVFTEDTLTGWQIIHAMYWRNGKPFLLDNNSSLSTCIEVSGNDIYVGGAMARPGGYDAATYWKNGSVVTLTDGKANARINSLSIQGTDVYAAGWITVGNGNPIAVFWKNGQLTKLSDSSYYCLANGIAVNGTDVYVVGQFMNMNSDSSTVICWKNGVALPLTDYPFSYATCVAVNNNDLYIGGVSSIANGYSNAATVWKNGVAQTLSVGNFGYQVNSLAVNGDSLYAAGFFGSPYYDAAYWQNGLPVNLPAPNAPNPINTGNVTSYASSLVTHGKDIYIAGGTNNANGNYQALLWKNGQAIVLKNGSDSTGMYTSGIAVQ